MAKPSSSHKVKLICSYGGKIQQNPVGNKLMYFGGDNKIVSVDRSIKYFDFVKKLNSVCRFHVVGIKYQLPGEDLNVLISLTNDDDLDNMMLEYDLVHKILSPKKTVRIRLFLDLAKPLLDHTPSHLDYLFGFDKEFDYNNNGVVVEFQRHDRHVKCGIAEVTTRVVYRLPGQIFVPSMPSIRRY